MPTDYMNATYAKIKQKYGYVPKIAPEIDDLEHSLDKELMPEYLHSCYDEFAKQGGDKDKIDTEDEVKNFHRVAYYTIDRNTVPDCLLDKYDEIAKTNNNDLVDSEKELQNFKESVRKAYNYGNITLSDVELMGFKHNEQPPKTGRYATNGYEIGRSFIPFPVLEMIPGSVGGLIGGAIGVCCDLVEYTQRQFFGKQNNDLVCWTDRELELFDMNPEREIQIGTK